MSNSIYANKAELEALEESFGVMVGDFNGDFRIVTFPEFILWANTVITGGGAVPVTLQPAVRASGIASTTEGVTEKGIADALASLSGTFASLTDTPALAGQAGRFVRINATSNALEYVALLATLIQFDNGTANIPGSPANVQAAIEGLKALVDGLPDQLSGATFADLPGTADNNSIIHIADASGDPAVTSGWAKYRYNGSAWELYLSQEDVSIVALTTAQVIDGNSTVTGTVTGQQIKAAIDAHAPKSRVFADDTTVAPATAGQPTEVEIAGFTTAGSITDAIVYYTGSDVAGDAPTHVYHVDKDGAVTLLRMPGTAISAASQADVTAGTANDDEYVQADTLKVELDKKEDKVDATVFQAVGSENSLGINTDDDTLQKIAVKLNAYIAEGGIDPWEAGKVYTDADLFTFSTTNTTAVDVNGNKIVSGEYYIGKYPGGATSGATLTNAEMLLIEVVSDAKQYEGLRGSPVADNAALTALPARDYERRKVTADGKEYVFELGAVSGTLADDAATGFWQEQIASGLVTTYIDSSAGATVTPLPSSTNAGVVRLFTNQDVTNTATLVVPSGQTLNGVTDGVFTFSNYSAGTQFRVDEVLGGYVVSVVGVSTQSALVNIDIPVWDAGSNISSSVFNGDGKYLFHVTMNADTSGGVLDRTIGVQLFNNTDSVVEENITDQHVDTGDGGSRTVTFEGTLEAGKDYVLRAANTNNLQSHGFYNAFAQQLPSTESVLAGMVVPEALAYGRMTLNGSTGASNDMGTVGAPVTALYGTADFSDDITANPATGEFTIVKSGKYRPKAFHSAENRNDDIFGLLYVDGVEVERILWQIPGTNATGALFEFAKRTFTAGQVVTFRLAGPTTDDVGDQNRDGIVEFFELEQVATSTVVMPDALEVEDIEELVFSTNNALNGGAFTFGSYADVAALQTAGFTRLRIQTQGLTASTNVEGGSTFVDLADIVANQRIAYHETDSAGFIIVLMDNGALAGGTFIVNGYTGNTVKIYAIKDQKTVINTTNTPVNDQAISGYMDIGNVRMQWGTDFSGISTSTVTLPAPFANADYSVTATVETNGTTVYAVGIESFTTTSFDYRAVFTSTGGSAGGSPVRWQAIGLKP